MQTNAGSGGSNASIRANNTRAEAVDCHVVVLVSLTDLATGNVDEQPCNSVGADYRSTRSVMIGTAVGDVHNIVGQHHRQTVDVTLHHGREKGVRQLTEIRFARRQAGTAIADTLT
jgi:hypothetical protein